MSNLAARYFFCMILYLCSLSDLCYAQDNTIALGSQTNFVLSNFPWSYLSTTNKNLQAQNVWELYTEKKFESISSDVFNGGIPNKYYWFHFKVVNVSDHNLSFYIDARSPRLNEVHLYSIQNNVIKKSLKTGDQLIFSQRPVDYKNFGFQYQLASSDSIDFLLFVNQTGNAFYLPLRFVSSNQFYHSIFGDYLLNGITLGVLLFVSTFSLLFYVNTGFKIYFYYSLYILTSISWVLSYFGLGFQYLWPTQPFINSFAAPLMASLNLLLTIQICQELFQIKEDNKKLFIAGNACKILLALAGFFPAFINLDKHDYVFNHTYLLIFLGTIIFSTLVSLYCVLYYILKRSKEATFYFIASIFKLISIFNLALMELGVTPALFNLEMLMLGGLIIELTLMSFALARQYKDLKTNKYEAVIKERERLARKLHDNISNTLMSVIYRFRLLASQPEEKTLKNLKDHLIDITKGLEQAQADVRNISHNIMPHNISPENLGTRINNYLKIFKNQSESENKVFPEFQFVQKDEKNIFSQEVIEEIFTTIQELLTNILKHSKATKAKIELNYTKKFLEIIIADNGIGINNPNLSNGIGLQNIKSFVQSFRGKIEIKNNSDIQTVIDSNAITSGSVVTICLPYKNFGIGKENNY